MAEALYATGEGSAMPWISAWTWWCFLSTPGANKTKQTNNKQQTDKQTRTRQTTRTTQQTSPPRRPRDQNLRSGSGAVEDRPGAAAGLSDPPN